MGEEVAMSIVELNILDVLQEKNMSLEEFAALPGIGEESANKIVEGQCRQCASRPWLPYATDWAASREMCFAIPPSDYRQRVVAGGLFVMALWRLLK